MNITSESTSVEQDHDFAISTGTPDREEMSELSDIPTENPAAAVEGSSPDNTMIHGVTEKAATSYLTSERVESIWEIFFRLLWEREQLMK